MDDNNKRPDPKLVRERLDREVGRDRGIILQSNNRAGAVGQWIAAVVTVAGILAAVILPRPNVSLTPTSTKYLYCVIGCFMLLAVSVTIMLWPRGLGRLPNDRDKAAYRRRIEAEAAALADGGPLDKEFDEGHFLQGNGRVKDRATQFGLVVLVGFIIFSVCFFTNLKY